MRRFRTISIIILFLATVFLPFWVYLPLIGAAMIFFPVFWEAIFFGLLIDVLYGGGIGSASELFSPMALSAALILIVLLPVRERIRVHV